MSKLRSDKIMKGITGAYARAMYRAIGYSEENLKKPKIAIINSFSETNPAHYPLRELAKLVREGVYMAGGMPVEFNTIAPCDAVAQDEGMHYILPSRDIIAASVELMVQAHQFDAMVMLYSCDKIVPGMLMVTARLNLPTIFMTGGAMMPRKIGNKYLVTCDIKEAMGKVKAGFISEKEFYEIESTTCATTGTCSMMGTAFAMSSIVEALGLSFPGSATMLTVDSRRYQVAQKVGERAVQLIKDDLLAPVIITLSIIGSYAINNNMFDVGIMFVFGLLGYLMVKYNFPRAPMVVGLILGPLAETGLQQSLLMSSGNWMIFVSKPLSVGLLLLAAISLSSTIIKDVRRTKRIIKNNQLSGSDSE